MQEDAVDALLPPLDAHALAELVGATDCAPLSPPPDAAQLLQDIEALLVAAGRDESVLPADWLLLGSSQDSDGGDEDEEMADADQEMAEADHEHSVRCDRRRSCD